MHHISVTYDISASFKPKQAAVSECERLGAFALAGET